MEEEETKIGSCQHPQCKKEMLKVHRCKYCGKYFCEHHMMPKNLKEPETDDMRFLERWRRIGHSCPEYSLNWEEKQQKIKEEQQKSRTETLPPRPSTESYTPRPGEIPPHYKTRNTIGILILLTLISLLLIYNYNLEDIAFNPDRLMKELSSLVTEHIPSSESPSPTLKKTTTTSLTSTTTVSTTTTIPAVIETREENCLEYCKSNGYRAATCLSHPNKCKIEEMAYERDGNMFCPKTDKGLDTFCCCGNKETEDTSSSDVLYLTPEELEEYEVTVEREQECKEALEYLNQIRESYDRNPIEWDDRIYDLTIFRTKDMYERDYYDHMTPEGKCAVDYKDRFLINEAGGLPENLGGLTYYVNAETGELVGITGECRDLIDNWLKSRGHRYNLLYPRHSKGAIGCYYYICAFIALTPDNFPCTSAKEGQEFWDTADEQEYEV